jgi:hypothetical protein
MSTLTANSPFTFATMSGHQYEAIKARTPNPSLPQGASRGAGYARRDNGMVGVGARNQTLATAGPQVSGGFRNVRLSRKAQHSRRTCLLPRTFVATETAGEVTKMTGGMRR